MTVLRRYGILQMSECFRFQGAYFHLNNRWRKDIVDLAHQMWNYRSHIVHLMPVMDDRDHLIRINRAFMKFEDHLDAEVQFAKMYGQL